MYINVCMNLVSMWMCSALLMIIKHVVLCVDPASGRHTFYKCRYADWKQLTDPPITYTRDSIQVYTSLCIHIKCTLKIIYMVIKIMSICNKIYPNMNITTYTTFPKFTFYLLFTCFYLLHIMSYFMCVYSSLCGG